MKYNGRKLHFFAILCALATSGAEPASVVISSFHPRGNVWQEGDLRTSFSNELRQTDFVTIHFNSGLTGNLQALVLETKHWKVNLTASVTSLSVSYPSRAVIAVSTWDTAGSISRLILQLPYLAGQKPDLGDQRERCRAREFVIHDSKIVEDQDYDLPRDRCWP